MREFPQVVRFRLVQSSSGDLVLRVVAPGTTGHAQGETLARALREKLAGYLGEPLGLDVELVDAIPDDDVKFRFFVSEKDRPGS